MFVSELSVLIDNIKLANEMIDAIDPHEEISEGLKAIMSTLKELESNLLSAIQNKIDDEHLLSICLEINDEINMTSERYKDLKMGMKPNKFISVFISYTPSPDIRREKYKNMNEEIFNLETIKELEEGDITFIEITNDLIIDLSEQPANSNKEKQSDEEKTNENHKKNDIIQELEDIFFPNEKQNTIPYVHSNNIYIQDFKGVNSKETNLSDLKYQNLQDKREIFADKNLNLESNSTLGIDMGMDYIDSSGKKICRSSQSKNFEFMSISNSTHLHDDKLQELSRKYTENLLENNKY